MSTHNICFCGEIKKILCGYPLLSVAMTESPLHELFCLKWDMKRSAVLLSQLYILYNLYILIYKVI